MERSKARVLEGAMTDGALLMIFGPLTFIAGGVWAIAIILLKLCILLERD